MLVGGLVFGGLALALNILGDRIDAFVDMTIVYPDGIPGYGEFWLGEVPRIAVDLRKIDIPTGVVRIGGHAFEGCSDLEEVNLPSTLKEIGIKEEQIIHLNLESADYDFKNYKELYDYINDKINSKQKYYVFIDEVQNVFEFQKAVDGLYIKKNVIYLLNKLQ